MEQHKINEADLISHWDAYFQLSNYSTEKKVNAIPSGTREAIGKFYSDLRRQGIYPSGTRDGRIQYQQSQTPTEKYQTVERLNNTDCKYGQCKTCHVMIYPEKTNCEIRTREWITGINNILSVTHRPIGEGKKLAEEFIDCMQHDFMGGIK